jgi:hypothetical protein
MKDTFWGDVLEISDVHSDGYLWKFRSGVKDYLEETGLELKNINWFIKTKEDFAEIKTTSITDWYKQFRAIPDVLWETIDNR